MCPVGNASPAATAPASELSSQSAQPWWVSSHTHTTVGSLADRRENAAAVGGAEHVVELFVDVLGLPLAVDGPNPLADAGVVAVTVEHARSRRSRNGTTSHSPSTSSAAFVAAVDVRLAQRTGARRSDHRRTGVRGGEQVVGDGAAVASDVVAGRGQQCIDLTHRLVAPQRLEHLVLLVGEHPLEFARSTRR